MLSVDPPTYTLKNYEQILVWTLEPQTSSHGPWPNALIRYHQLQELKLKKDMFHQESGLTLV